MKLIKKNKQNNELTTEEKFQNLLYWKNEWKKIKNELNNLEDSDYSEDELEDRENRIKINLAEAEEAMINVKKGLYFGTAHPLTQDSNPEPIPLYAKWSNLNNHVGYKGTTRVGKTQSMIGHIDQCIEKGWDVIILEPKGGVGQDVLSATAESAYKHKRAEEISYYSPAFVNNLSEKVNLLYGKSNLEITSMLIDSIKEPNMDSFYLEIASRIILAETTSFEFLQAISDPEGLLTKYLEEEEVIKYHEFVNSSNYEEELKYGDMIEKMKLDSEIKKEIKELTDIGFNRTLLTYKDLERYCSYEGLTELRNLVDAIPVDKKATDAISNKQIRLKIESLRILDSALKTDKTFFDKVSTTLANRLLQLSVGPIGDMLCGTRINPLANKLLNKEKGVIAVIQPFPMKFKKSAEMFNKTFLGMLDSMMGTVGVEGRALPRRVAIFIDEAGAIAYPGIENFFNRAGGLGTTVFVYTQSDEDYSLAVGDTIANVIIDNVNTKVIMRQNLQKSANDAAETIGTVQNYKTIAMVSAGGADGRYTSDIQKEYICEPSDIQALPVGEGIIIHDGKKYYLEAPFRLPPKGAFKMPELETEQAQKHLIEFEKQLLANNEKALTISTEIEEAYEVDVNKDRESIYLDLLEQGIKHDNKFTRR